MQHSLKQSALALVAGLLVLATFGAASAVAHVQLVSSSPKAGSTVQRVSQVSLTFSGPIRNGSVTVVGPGNRTVSKGHGGRDPRNIDRLAVALSGGLKSGSYRVSASWIAADGHHQTGAFSFRIKK